MNKENPWIESEWEETLMQLQIHNGGGVTVRFVRFVRVRLGFYRETDCLTDKTDMKTEKTNIKTDKTDIKTDM